MPRRHPLPRVWLMTDERMGEDLWPALDRLPRGAGVVFRHYRTGQAERRALMARVIHLGRPRGLLILSAGEQRLGPGGRGRHGGRRPCSAAVHSFHELRLAHAAGARLVFVSPLFATRSHPGASSLSRMQAAAIVRTARVPAIALGGMDERRFRQVRQLGFHGWAAIDAWLPRQKRKAVPT